MVTKSHSSESLLGRVGTIMKHFSVVAGDPLLTRRELAEQIEQLQGKIHQLATLADRSDDTIAAAVTPHPENAQRVREILRGRRARSRFFESELFADPAWDILLELYGSHLAGQRMSVSSLCLGASVPATTALRWIKLLESKGLILRSDDPFDGRRVFIQLSPPATAAMHSLFDLIPPGEALI